MSHVPGVRPAHDVLPVQSIFSVGASFGLGYQIGAPASATWPAANRAIFVPFYLPERRTATKLYVANGAAVSGNIDLGIYDAAGARLVSAGSTAQAGVTTTQIVDITDTVLPPGTYYLAMSMDNTTGTTMRHVPNVNICRMLAMAQEALGSVVLPATATLAVVASGYIPCLGVSFRTVTGSV